jgi:hypothetical protein
MSMVGMEEIMAGVKLTPGKSDYACSGFLFGAKSESNLEGADDNLCPSLHQYMQHSHLRLMMQIIGMN